MIFLSSSLIVAPYGENCLKCDSWYLRALTLTLRSLLSRPSRFLMLLAMSLGALMDYFLQRLHKQAKTSKHYVFLSS